MLSCILLCMKIWLKYLLGCAIGIAMAFVLQGDNNQAVEIINYISDLAVNIGKYSLVPLLFFTMTVSVFELREDKSLLRIALKTIIIAVITTVGLMILGLVAVTFFPPARIPVSVGEVSQNYTLSITENIMKIFPSSNFESFLDGSFLLPLYVLAGFAGAGCAAERNSKPMLNLFDSISRVSYAVMSFFIEILAIGFIALSASWTFMFFKILKSSSMLYLAGMVSCIAFVVIIIIYPLILRFSFKERHPYKLLYAATASILTAFFSGNYNLTLGVMLRHAKESLGVKRRIGSVTLPVFSTFARGGSAMILVISFVVILKSYIDYGVLENIPWILITSFVISFFLGSLPAEGIPVALSVMCSLYGRGFENGYLILKPVMFFLCSIAAVIDAATAFFGTYCIALKEHKIEHQNLHFYI